MFAKETLAKLQEASQRYDDEVRRILAALPGAPQDYSTVSGLPVKPLYTPTDLEDIDYQRDIAFPGQYPYTRGVFPAGYRSRLTNSRQVTGLGTAEETNQRWKFLISQGATALAVVYSNIGGYDSDDPQAEGFAGKDGIVVDSLYDYETLFDGIDLRKITVNMIAGSGYALACYLAIAEQQGIPFHELRGSMSNILRNSKDCLDIIEFCAKHVPKFNAGNVDVRNVREGGCTAAQEIAFGTALAMATIESLVEKGVDVDTFASRMTWFVNCGPEFFEEVAKFRALRRIWARTLRERYGAKDPRSWQCRMHCQTYAPSMTQAQPFNNLIRSTLYALAAIMGGVQSLSVNAFDEAFAIPSELSHALALRTQQIINLESGIPAVVDPMGGSYYLEDLTNRIESEALAIIETIQSKGGAFEAFDWMCNEIRDAALEWQQQFDRGERPLVGANVLIDEDDIQMKAFKAMQSDQDLDAFYEYDPAVRDKQIERLNKVRRERDPAKLEASAKAFIAAVKRGENMIPTLVECVKSYMTQGEAAKAYAQGLGVPLERIFLSTLG
jgi:methylmalonyl-CoA mutase N-terminal domain/subunit